MLFNRKTIFIQWRIAPTFPDEESLREAMNVLTLCVRIAAAEQILADGKSA